MIAIPVKMDKVDSAVSPLFGKAKYFAIVRNGQISIVKNPVHGGRGVVNWLKSVGVNKLLTAHIGENPFMSLMNCGVQVYFVGKDRITINGALLKYADGDLVQVTNKNYDDYLKEEKHEHEHSHEEGHSCCSTKQVEPKSMLYFNLKQSYSNINFKG